MKIVYILLLLQLLFSACVHKYHSRNLPVLTINDRPQSRYIVNRIPEYGDGQKDGCIVLPEMQVDLIIAKKLLLSGVVSDITSKEPLKDVSITVNTLTRIELKSVTNQQGQFKMDIPQQVSRMEVNYRGYRSVVINF